MAREMREFPNASLTAGKINLKLKDGFSTYRAIGWVQSHGDYLKIYAEDMRRTKPLMVVPKSNVDAITVDLLS